MVCSAGQSPKTLELPVRLSMRQLLISTSLRDSQPWNRESMETRPLVFRLFRFMDVSDVQSSNMPDISCRALLLVEPKLTLVRELQPLNMSFMLSTQLRSRLLRSTDVRDSQL